MPVAATRTLIPQKSRYFGQHGDTSDTSEIPPLTDIQTVSYARFLQLEERSRRHSSAKASLAY